MPNGWGWLREVLKLYPSQACGGTAWMMQDAGRNHRIVFLVRGREQRALKLAVRARGMSSAELIRQILFYGAPGISVPVQDEPPDDDS